MDQYERPPDSMVAMNVASVFAAGSNWALPAQVPGILCWNVSPDGIDLRCHRAQFEVTMRAALTHEIATWMGR
jgi:hypothetical protein